MKNYKLRFADVNGHFIGSEPSGHSFKFIINIIYKIIEVSVSELVGWVRNVVLIKCIFGSGKPRGVGILGERVYEPAEGMRS